MSDTTTTTKTDITTSELIQSLTGYEEDAIRDAFGKDFEDLDGAAFIRSMIFIDQKRREGVKPTAALRTAKGLKRSEVMAYFPPAVEEAMPDEPTTESGND